MPQRDSERKIRRAVDWIEYPKPVGSFFVSPKLFAPDCRPRHQFRQDGTIVFHITVARLVTNHRPIQLITLAGFPRLDGDPHHLLMIALKAGKEVNGIQHDRVVRP